MILHVSCGWMWTLAAITLVTSSQTMVMRDPMSFLHRMRALPVILHRQPHPTYRSTCSQAQPSIWSPTCSLQVLYWELRSNVLQFPVPSSQKDVAVRQRGIWLILPEYLSQNGKSSIWMVNFLMWDLESNNVSYQNSKNPVVVVLCFLFRGIWINTVLNVKWKWMSCLLKLFYLSAHRCVLLCFLWEEFLSLQNLFFVDPTITCILFCIFVMKFCYCK